MKELEIESAKLDDAQAIQKLYYNAVKSANNFYTFEVLEAWAKPDTEESLDKIRKAIKDEKEFLVVARLNNKVVGFGSVIPSENELRAVYVDPEFGRLGVGGRILQELEVIAKKHNAKILKMDASLNAESFYKKNGYKVLKYDFHTLSNGTTMKCVNMEKAL